MDNNKKNNQANIGHNTPSTEGHNVIKHSYVPPTTIYPPMPTRPDNSNPVKTDSKK